MQQVLQQGYFVLFIILSFGLMAGNLKYKGFSLDSSAVIFVAMLFGHFGYKVPSSFQTLGLLLFIFTIGIQAGPGFFDALLRYGKKLILIGFVVIGVAALLTFAAVYLLDVPVAMAVGLFNGALTSTPGLAAAVEATGSPITAVGYGIAYPAGVILVILFVQLIPGWLRVKLEDEEKNYLDQLHEDNPELTNRVLQITNANIDGKLLKDIDLRKITGGVISRVSHGGIVIAPTAETILHLGDFVKVVGDEASLGRMELLLGQAVNRDLPFDNRFAVNWVLVTNKKVVSKSLRELNLTAYNATITRIRRSGIDLKPLPHSKLRFGDKLLISGSNQEMQEVMRLMGNDEKRLSETNFLPIALGVVLGILVGSVSVPVGSLFNFSLGLTGGVLATALLLSNLGRTGPILWSMSGSGNQLLRKLGLLLFMASVGTSAGSEIGQALQANGLQLIAIGAVITTLPMIAGLLVGHYVMKMNFLSLLGVITGAMTSTPGLAAIDSKTDSDAPSVGYATVYPTALVLMIVFSQLLALIKL